MSVYVLAMDAWTCEHSEFTTAPCSLCWENQVLKERAQLLTLVRQISANRKVPAGVKDEIAHIISTFKLPG